VNTPLKRSVKGSVLVDYVRMIRANPDLPWTKYLTPEDMEVVKQMILPASWYDIEFFQRVGLAVFKLVAKENYALLRAYGGSRADKLNLDHPGMVSKGDPRSTLEKYIRIQRSFYSFDAFKIEEKGPCRILVHIYSTPEEVGIPVYIEQIRGMVERLLDLSGQLNVKIDVTTSEEQNMVRSTMEVSWQS
jgi:hypothetical protein